MHCVLEFQKGTNIQGVFPESGLCPFFRYREHQEHDSPFWKFNPFVISLKLQSTICRATHLAFDQKRTQWLSKCLLQAFKKISY